MKVSLVSFQVSLLLILAAIQITLIQLGAVPVERKKRSILCLLVIAVLGSAIWFFSGLASWLPSEVLVPLIVIGAGFFPFHSWLRWIQRVLGRIEASLFLGVFPSAALIPELIARGEGGASRVVLAFALFDALYRSGVSLTRQSSGHILADLRASFLAMTLVSLYTGELATAAFVFLSLTGNVSFFILDALDIHVARVREKFHLRPHEGHLGMRFHLPRGARYFLVATLVLMGVPGASGFLAEDFLFHGLLDRSGWAMVGFLCVAGLSALSLYRLYARIFLGPAPIALLAPPQSSVDWEAPDDLPRALQVTFGFLIFLLLTLGIAPRLLLGQLG